MGQMMQSYLQPSILTAVQQRTPAPCLQLLHGSIAHGAVVGRRGIVSRTAAVQPPFTL
jgi:hypothetical protein